MGFRVIICYGVKTMSVKQKRLNYSRYLYNKVFCALLEEVSHRSWFWVSNASHHFQWELCFLFVAYDMSVEIVASATMPVCLLSGAMHPSHDSYPSGAINPNKLSCKSLWS